MVCIAVCLRVLLRLAPFPASKARVVTSTVSKALTFLDEGR